MDNKQQKNFQINFAMLYGLYLGVYFILKFLLSTITYDYLILSIPSFLMVIGIPFLSYWMITQYRDRYNNGALSFYECWSTTMLMFLFASLPESLIQFVYLQYLNPDYLHSQTTKLVDILNSLNYTEPAVLQFIQQLKEAPVPSGRDVALQNIFNNVFFASILGLIFSFIAKREPQNSAQQ